MLGENLTERIMSIVRLGATGPGASTATTIQAAEDVVALLRQAGDGQAQQESEAPKPNPKPKPKSGKNSPDEGADGDNPDQGESPPASGPKGEGEGEAQAKAGDGDGEAEPGEEEGGGSSSGSDDEAGDEAGDPGSRDSDDGDSTDDSEAGTAGDAGGDPNSESEGVGEAIDTQAVQSTLTDSNVQGDLAELIGKVIGGLTVTEHSSVRDLAAFRADVGSFRANAGQASLAARLRGRLAEHLRSQVEDDDGCESDRGMLVGSRLVDAVLGDNMVFEEEGAEGEGLNTAVTVLVDASGSMDGVEAESALAAIYACSTALGSFAMQGVAFSLHAFSERILTFKEFHDPWLSRRGSLASYEAEGYTYTPHAIRTVLPALCARREKRKILYLITDGDTGRDDTLAPLLEVGRRNRNGKVEFRVLLIGTTIRATCFDQVGTVAPGTDLQKAIFAGLKECF